MSLRNFKTSNPVFNGYFWDDGKSSSKTMSVSGIFFKSIEKDINQAGEVRLVQDSGMTNMIF